MLSKWWYYLNTFSPSLNVKNDVTYKIKTTEDYPLYPFEWLESLGLIKTTPKGLFPIDSNGS